MAYVVNLSFDLRHWPQFVFEDIEKGTFMGLESGEARHPDGVPTRARLTSKSEEVPDFVQMAGCWAVSGTFRGLVERLEPKVHQFLPVELILGPGRTTPKNYFLLNICQKIDAVIPERSNVDAVLNEATGNVLLHPGAGPPVWVVDGHAIKGLHLWRGARQLRDQILFSDVLMSAVRSKDLKYIEGHHAEEA